MSVDAFPLPTEIEYGKATGTDGTIMYTMTIHTPLGAQMIWFTPEGMEAHKAACHQLTSGLIIPPSTEVKDYGRSVEGG